MEAVTTADQRFLRQNGRETAREKLETAENAGSWHRDCKGKETPTDYAAVTRRGNERKAEDNGLAVVIGGVSQACLWITLWINGRVIHMPANGVFRRFGGISGVLATLPYPRPRSSIVGRLRPVAGDCLRPETDRQTTGNKKPPVFPRGGLIV